MKKIFILLCILTAIGCKNTSYVANEYTQPRLMYCEVIGVKKHAILVQDLLDRGEYKICFQEKTTTGIFVKDALVLNYIKDKYYQNNLIRYKKCQK